MELKTFNDPRTASGPPDISPSSSSDSEHGVQNPLLLNDQDDMLRLGKEQVYARNFRFFATLGFISVFVSTWEFILTATYSGLVNGGFGGLVWEYVWTFLCYSTIVVSLAEMTSMAPTAGGQYHWVSEFAPKRYQRVLSYISGWTSVVAWQPALAAGLYPSAVMIESLAKFHNADFVLERWQASLLMIGLGFLTVPFNTVWRKALPAFESAVLVLHFLGFAVTFITLWVLAPKNSAKEVFTEIVNSGGWSSTGLSLLVGQVAVFYCMAGFDSAVHLAEEVEDAGYNVPRAMVWAFALNGAMGFAMLITFLFCIGTLDDALNAAEPFVQAFLNAGTGAATALTLILLVLFVAANNTCTTTESRQLWAFARDRGLPGSAWLCKLHPKWNVPVNSIIVTMVINVVLCLINLGNDFAFNIIVGVSSAGQLMTYIVSIGSLISKRLRGEPLPRARWSLGRWGLAINSFAFVYASFLLIFVFFPVSVPVTSETMNWTVVLVAGVIAISAAFYFAHGKKVFTSPVVFVQGRREGGAFQGLPEANHSKGG